MRARVKITGDDVHSSHDTASPVKFCRKWTPRTPTSSGARRDRVAAALSSGRPRRVLGENCRPSPGHARTGGEEARGRVPATQSEVPRRGHSGDVTPRPPTPHVPEPEPAARSPSPGSNAAPRRSQASTRGTGNSRVSTPRAKCSEPPPNLPLKVTNLQCGKILTNIE